MAGKGQVFRVDLHPQKEKIVEMILAGCSVRLIGATVVPPIEFNAIQRYKVSVIKPMLARAQQTGGILNAQKGNLVIQKAIHGPMSTDTQALQTVKESIQDAPTLSIFRHRLEKLHQVIDRTITKAETSVRVAPDKDGNLVVIGADLGVIAPLMNQAHKNLEMLGRATGELEPQGGTNVSIQIVVPGTGTAAPRIVYADRDVPAIEGTAEEIEEDVALTKRQW